MREQDARRQKFSRIVEECARYITFGNLDRHASPFVQGMGPRFDERRFDDAINLLVDIANLSASEVVALSGPLPEPAKTKAAKKAPAKPKAQRSPKAKPQAKAATRAPKKTRVPSKIPGKAFDLAAAPVTSKDVDAQILKLADINVAGVMTELALSRGQASAALRRLVASGKLALSGSRQKPLYALKQPELFNGAAAS